ncbi:hypothetical protein BGI33_04720 [Snodgrassella alvi]|uniref:hypothetical protein n=1 Tax=Snodgrassella alvi TaxID=1196083 RepID=UPI000C1E5A58|nr:hypothetical protein [Snodgrassella alvi]PIT15297.1 hypothetical protein BGI34_12610 [Snodgrassella alvi]PIT16370.1 hypothetical protein BGI33_04720 [Snodgrassella alvi]
MFNELANVYFVYRIKINAGTLADAVFRVLAAMGNKLTMPDNAVATIFFTLHILQCHPRLLSDCMDLAVFNSQWTDQGTGGKARIRCFKYPLLII